MEIARDQGANFLSLQVIRIVIACGKNVRAEDNTLFYFRPEAVAARFLPMVAQRLGVERHVELRGDAAACAIAPIMIPATEDDWRAEYLDLILAVRSSLPGGRPRGQYPTTLRRARLSNLMTS